MASCLDSYMCCCWSIFCVLLSRARRRGSQGRISGFPFCRVLCVHRSEVDGAVLLPLVGCALTSAQLMSGCLCRAAAPTHGAWRHHPLHSNVGGGDRRRQWRRRRWRRRRRVRWQRRRATTVARRGGRTGRRWLAAATATASRQPRSRQRARRRQLQWARLVGAACVGVGSDGRGAETREMATFRAIMPMTTIKNCSLNARNQVKIASCAQFFRLRRRLRRAVRGCARPKAEITLLPPLLRGSSYLEKKRDLQLCKAYLIP